MKRRRPTKQYCSMDTNIKQSVKQIKELKGLASSLRQIKKLNILPQAVLSGNDDIKSTSVSVLKSNKIQLPQLSTVTKNKMDNCPAFPTIPSIKFLNKERPKLSSERLPKTCNERNKSINTRIRKDKLSENTFRYSQYNSIMDFLTQRESHKEEKQRKSTRQSRLKKRLIKLESIDTKNKQVKIEDEKRVIKELNLDHIFIILSSNSSRINAHFDNHNLCYEKRGNIKYIDMTIAEAARKKIREKQKQNETYIKVSGFYNSLYKQRLNDENQSKKVHFNDICTFKKRNNTKAKKSVLKENNNRLIQNLKDLEKDKMKKRNSNLLKKKRKIDSMLTILNEEKTSYLQSSRIDELVARKSYFKHINK